MIIDSNQNILLKMDSQARAIEKFRRDLERVFRIQIAKNKFEGGFSFPIYTQAHHEDGGVYQYNYMTYFGLEFWKWDKEQRERRIQLQIDAVLKKIVSHMISVDCDIETLKPKSTVDLYDTR